MTHIGVQPAHLRFHIHIHITNLCHLLTSGDTPVHNRHGHCLQEPDTANRRFHSGVARTYPAMVLGLGRHEERQLSRDGQASKLQSFDSTNDIVGMTVRFRVPVDTRVCSMSSSHAHACRIDGMHCALRTAIDVPSDKYQAVRVFEVPSFVMRMPKLVSFVLTSGSNLDRTAPDPSLTRHDSTQTQKSDATFYVGAR